MLKTQSKHFVGRDHEIERLTQLTRKQIASLVVIKGRRRIGKSRLIEEFAANKTFYHFAGLPPTIVYGSISLVTKARLPITAPWPTPFMAPIPKRTALS